MTALRWFTLILTSLMVATLARAGDIKGRVEMPAICSPTVSPAVVSLERLDGRVELAKPGPGVRVALVNQKGLQFEPRVQAVQAGQTVQFRNEDNETHNVHILTPGVPFNQSMSRGLAVDYRAEKPGLLRIVCDVHSHMRGFVVVSPTPYFDVCRADGSFTLRNVANGRYRLQVWHEMGQGTSREIDVKDGAPVEVGTLRVEAAPLAVTGPAGPVRNWAEVTDRVGVLLSEARALVLKDKDRGIARARKLVEDAYFEEFEGSQMETAVRRHLGFQRSGDLEGLFRGLRPLVREVGEKKASPAVMADRSRQLMLGLVRAGEDLNRLGVTDRTKLGSAVADASTPLGDVQAHERALAEAFDGVAVLANSGNAGEASSSLATAYLEVFEPLEAALTGRRPQEVAPLEARFNALRGRIDGGLKGEALATELAALRGEISDAINRSRSGGTFGAAFFASLVTALREGVEVILLLTMLLALVAKAGQPKALSAIRWGVGAAVVASVLTAFALNLLVATSRGRVREQIEGWVMMIAAGVLFYVSYWLISQAESKRWTDFLKEQVKRGVAAGGFGTLGLTAFLAVYREGAETALLYQAMLVEQAGSRTALLGILAGIAVGLVGLTAIYLVIRKTSVKLPLRSFFKLTGVVLFGMAVVFAGNGVFALQNAKLLRTTTVSWLGNGLPLLGLHPNLQVLEVQGLLLGGALVAFVLLATNRGQITSPITPTRERVAAS
jgi:high-affinity iron transporter